MRYELFEQLAPVCPRCLHLSGQQSPLKIAERLEERAGHLWHGLLHCTNEECWSEYPVIDGIPVITADPLAFLKNSNHHVLTRTDMPEQIAGMLSDALGAGSEYDTLRQHLSIYANDHYADWMEPSGTSFVAKTIDTGLNALGDTGEGPVLDFGGSVGRGAWEIASRRKGPVLVGDLNFSMLKLAQELMLEGQASFYKRRIGVVYDRVTAHLPAQFADLPVDFWAIDVLALPFLPESFSFASAINLVDCVPGPTEVITEMARILAPDAKALLTTPFDWAPNATEMTGWIGGHSQRGAWSGNGEPVLKATLERAGLKVTVEKSDLPWQLHLHARSVMHYELHMVGCRKTG